MGIGMLLVAVGCCLIYLTSRHQAFLRSPLSVTFRIFGWVFLLGGLVSLLLSMQAVAAVFTFMIWSMAVLILLPYTGALFSRSKVGRFYE